MGRCHVNYEESRGCVHLEQSPPCTGILLALSPLSLLLAIFNNVSMEIAIFKVKSDIFSIKISTTMTHASLITDQRSLSNFIKFQFVTFAIALKRVCIKSIKTSLFRKKIERHSMRLKHDNNGIKLIYILRTTCVKL